MCHFITVFLLIELTVAAYIDGQSYQFMERIDCSPNKKLPFAKEDCLARNCLFDDEALPDEIQCYTVKINQGNRNLHRIQMIKTHESTLAEQNPELMTVELPEIIKIDPQYRIDCAPDIDEYRSFCMIDLSENPTLNTTNQSCTARGCVWEPNAGLGIATCYIPIEKGGYQLTGGPNQLSNNMTQYTLTRLINSPDEFSMFNHDINNLDVQVSVSGPAMVRMTIRDANAQRYEVPVPIQWNSNALSSIPAKIKFQMTNTSNGQIGFRVQRSDTQSILFDTSFFANGFVYDDKFIQIITTIPSKNVYGFGENTHSSFRHNLIQSRRYGMFARDQWPSGVNENLYGTHPFYMGIEPDGRAFGIFIFNSNAQDYKFDEFDTDQAMLTYRTIGGILDMFFFAGPDPENVIRQYQSVIGKPYMPPYWALGFQLSRYGFNTLTNMKAAMQRTLDAQIPLDVMYGDIDYFRNQLDFTWDPEGELYTVNASHSFT